MKSSVTADTILRDGHVWTGLGQPRATALAIRDGRIVAVGERDQVMHLAGPRTQMVGLAGQTVVPGFVDAHAHVWKIGHLLTTLLDLRAADGVAWLADRLRDHSQRLPRGMWLHGRGYNEARFPGGRGPTRADLDAIVSDRPVVLMRTCAHIVVCNTVALAAAGIDRYTPSPPGGEIERDRDGEPTGVLRETAMALVLRQMPQPSGDDYEAMITAALNHQLSHGITSTTDAGVAVELLETYRRLDADGRLPCRVNVMALGVIDGEGPAPLPAARHVSNRLRIDTVKYFADGGLSGATAALSVPYRHADTRGVLRHQAGELLALARPAHEAGWRIATHAIGDEAIGTVLSVYEQLGRGPVRHRIEHFGLPTAEQLARAARIGVIAAPQSIFLRELGRNFRNYLPDPLLARAYPLRAMLDAGITVALSSDAPVVEDDSPLAGMQAAILRRDADEHVIAPAQAISLAEALDAYTRAGAIASGDEHLRGTITVGSCADLAVISGALETTPAEALTTLRVTQTWVDGRPMYDRGSS